MPSSPASSPPAPWLIKTAEIRTDWRNFFTLNGQALPKANKSMARALKYTAETRSKWLAEGRGSGVGTEYKSWLTIHDVHGPLATKSRVIERCHGRQCHLLSGLERRTLLYYDFSKATTAIYDQFRLDIEETQEIAKSLGIDHPRVPGTGEPWDMTTDLVVHLNLKGKELIWPRSCKMEKDIGNFNNIEHAQIERTWWSRRGHTLKFCTDTDRCVPYQLSKNLEIIYPVRFLHDELTPYPRYLEDMKNRMLFALFAYPTDCTLSQFCMEFDVNSGTFKSDALRLALYFIYQGYIQVDMFSKDIREQNIFNIQELSGGIKR